MSVDLDALNSKHCPALMTFGWNYCGLSKATDVKITALNDASFGVKVFLKRKETKDIVYNFTPEDKKKATDLSDRVALVLRRHMGASLPPAGLIAIICWFVAILAIVPIDKLFVPFNIMKPLISKYISEKIGMYLLYFLIGTHVLEGLYTLVTIPSVVKTPPNILSWVVMDLICGFPVTERVMILSKLQAKIKK